MKGLEPDLGWEPRNQGSIEPVLLGIVRLEEEVSERSGFPCTIDVNTSGKVSLSFRFADNHGLDAFLKQQKFVVDD